MHRITESPWFHRVRERLYAVDVEDVHAILDALTASASPAWLVGGWGVDALLDGEIRPHWDVDLMVPDDATTTRSLAALSTLGYERVEDGGSAGHWLPVRMVLRNRAGRTIELLFVRLSADAPPGPIGGAGAPIIDVLEDVTTGQLGGRLVPCASARFQVRVHTGYEPTPHDRRDVLALCRRFGVPLPAEYSGQAAARPHGVRRRVRAKLRRMRRRGPDTAVVLPVPGAEALLELSGEPPPMSAVPAHITLVYPFAPPSALTDRALGTLRHLAAATPRFTMTMATVGRFPDVLFAAPDPDAAAHVTVLTEAIVLEWPSYPPYGGRFASIVPHVTVHEGPVEPAGIEARLRALLPIASEVEELWLLVQDPGGGWSILDRFPLGPAA